MSAVVEVSEFNCPRCRHRMSRALHGPGPVFHCPACDWQGEAYLLRPVQFQVEEAQAALPEDAVCVHHPTKRATTICAGTGDYICSLCSVTMDGRTYSAQYLDKGGKATLEKAFARELRRPDRGVLLAALASMFFPFLAIAFVPFGIYRLVQTFRARKENPLFNRLVGPGQMALLTIGSIICACLGLGYTTFLLSLMFGR